ncbi:MAG: hypothetical protein JXB23_14785, partial [Candidatus Aminicenantes bacterium]|nr:hypothetical protein [Candidatus Aminicenantes bacterium]
MSTKFFKKIELFKGTEVTPKRTNNSSSPSNKEKKNGFWYQVGRNPFVFAAIFVVAIAYLIAYIPSRYLPHPKEGEIASADIVAPEDLTIEDIDATAQKRDEAVQAILPVYIQDPNV